MHGIRSFILFCILYIVYCFPLTALNQGARADEAVQKAEWTVMFYFCGSDLESKYGFATENLKGIYDCDAVFFDTPDDEMSLVKVLTYTPSGREMALNASMHVVLRGCYLGGELPAYSISDHLFVLSDGTRGHLSLFDDFYTVSFDGDTFDSPYTRIGGIAENDLCVTIKGGQEI